jgi:serralysin
MPQRSLTTQQAAAELTRSGQSWAQDLHQPVIITYGFLSSGFGNIAFTERQIALAKECLQLWADVANIDFVEVSAATAQINFVNSNLESAGGEWDSSGQIIRINLASSGEALPPPWQSSVSRIGAPLGELPDTDKETLLHEIGHALGLDHPGNYNASDAEAPTYADDAGYVQDTKQYSIMSYFGASNSGANHGSEVPLTPLLHDMAAIQRLYGFNMNTRTGNDVYGFNSTTARASYTIEDEWDQAVFAIWDGGGTDTLDLSGYNHNAFIDLTPGRHSSAGGLVNNIAISEHVLIENAKGGDGNDSIYGNWSKNVLTGGGGHDVLDGKSGADTMIGGAGDDTYYVDDANDKIIDSRSARVSSWPTPSYVSYNTGIDNVLTTLNTYTLQEHLENVFFEGSGAFQGYGNDANNHIKAGSGTDHLYGYDRDDILDGGAGADRMYGGAGNDTYFVDDVGDVVSELGNAVAPVIWNGQQTQSWSSRLYPTDAGGIDEIATTVNNYSLTDKPFIENLSFVGSGRFTGVGSALDK